MYVKEVLLTALQEQIPFFNSTILSRPDIALTCSGDINAAVQLLFKAPPDLFVVRDNYGPSLPMILSNLSIRYPKAPFQTIVLTDSKATENFPPIVKCFLPTDVPLAKFNEAVASLLKMPTRKSSRLPIRIGVDLSQHGNVFLANSVNISGSGILLETLQRLDVGKEYQMRFLGIAGSNDLPMIKARIVRQVIYPAKAALNTKYYAMEFVGISVGQVESFLDKLLPV